MKIAASTLNMASTHSAQQQREIRESLRFWQGNQRPAVSPPPSREIVSLSDEGLSAQATAAAEDASIDGDPRLNLLRRMLEALTGERFRVFDVSELNASISNTRATSADVNFEAVSGSGSGLEYDYSERYSEVEQTQFSASGKVLTADGREITFNIELSMARSYVEERNLSVRLGDAARKKDPLVLNFAGNAAQLSDSRFAFDLDADGDNEQINRLLAGSAYLVFDRNGDGKVNDGSELFGPTLGNGFHELALLDADANGWIDENDPAFSQLSLWHGGDNSDQLQKLTDAGVGALALQATSTPFDMKSSNNQLLGQIRSSGIFLQDRGTAGTIQQIDLTA